MPIPGRAYGDFKTLRKFDCFLNDIKNRKPKGIIKTYCIHFFTKLPKYTPENFAVKARNKTKIVDTNFVYKRTYT